MFGILLLVPAGTSFTLGTIYLFLGESRPAFKAAGIGVFLLAFHLQFFTRHSLAGLLLQTALALGLAFWKRAATAE